MRTFFTLLAFLVILWAVIPAVRRSLLPAGRATVNPDGTFPEQKV